MIIYKVISKFQILSFDLKPVRKVKLSQHFAFFFAFEILFVITACDYLNFNERAFLNPVIIIFLRFCF